MALGVALIAGGLMPAAAGAGTVTPTDGVDEYNTDSGHCSLREAITAAQTTGTFNGCATLVGPAVVDVNADTIQLNPAVTYHLSLPGDEDANASGDLDLVGAVGDQDLTITTTGPGRATIDANGDGVGDPVAATDDRVFHVGPGGNSLTTPALLNLDITDGEAGVLGGGGIRQQSGINLFITNSTIRENKATGGLGGGFTVTGNGFPLVSNSEISDNTAGLIGGINVDDGAPGIVATTIEGNRATAGSGEGGGLAVDLGESASLFNSTVSGNEATGYGGGAFVSGTLNLINATVAGNTADSDANNPPGDGGGVYNLGTVNARNSIIADNIDASPSPMCTPTAPALDHLAGLQPCRGPHATDQAAGSPAS